MELRVKISQSILAQISNSYFFGDQEKVEWIEEPVDRLVKQNTVDEVHFTAKVSVKGKKAKWYLRNQVGTRHYQYLELFCYIAAAACRQDRVSDDSLI